MQPLLQRYMQGDASVEPQLLAALRERSRPPGRGKKGKKNRRR
jgi:hypothetical protein